MRLAELVKKLTVLETACGRSHGGAGALARTYVVRVELRAGGDGDLAGDDDEDQDEESEESESDESARARAESDSGRVSFAQMARAFKREFAKRLVGEIKLELRRRGAGASRIHAGREEGTRTGAPRTGTPRRQLLDGDESRGEIRASAAAAAAEDGEDGDDSDEEDAEDEEGAKTEGRRGARGDGGEKYTEKGDEEKQGGKKDGDEKGASRKATAVETRLFKEREREEETTTTERRLRLPGSGSDDAMATSSDSDADADSPRHPDLAQENFRRGTRRGSGSSRSLRRSWTASLWTAPGARASSALSLALDAPRLLMLETAERVAAATVVRRDEGHRQDVRDRQTLLGGPVWYVASVRADGRRELRRRLGQRRPRAVRGGAHQRRVRDADDVRRGGGAADPGGGGEGRVRGVRIGVDARHLAHRGLHDAAGRLPAARAPGWRRARRRC